MSKMCKNPQTFPGGVFGGFPEEVAFEPNLER